MRMLTRIVLAAACAAAMAEALAESTQIAPSDSWERYRVLAERNMFLKSRSRRREDRGFVAMQPVAQPVHTPEQQATLLTGVARQGEGWIAFLEDGSGSTTRVRAGQSFAGGAVELIGFNGIEYTRGENRKTIAVGQNLAGAWPVLPSYTAPTPAITPSPGGVSTTTAATPGATTVAQPAGSAVTVSAGSEDILERMRRRRAEELKQ